MGWRIWITWWIIFYIRYSRLFRIYIKKHREKNVDSSIRININKVENRITFEIKTETMKLLESTKKKMTINENGKNVPRVVLLK